MNGPCLRLYAALESLEPMRSFVEENALRAGLDEGQIRRIELALEEATINIIRHAYGGQGGKMELCCTPVEDGLEIRLVDEGPPFDPLQVPAVEFARDIASREIGGVGIRLIRSMADALHYRREEGRNVLTLYFKRKSGDSS
jgi:serine/threonine-protein kinase RsbW